MQNRPLVKRLDEDWTAGKIVTLDVMDPQIREFGDEVGFEVTPTFILFDAMGNELRRWVGRAPAVDDLSISRLQPSTLDD